MWTPKVVFVNTELRDGLLRDEKATATIALRGGVTLASDDVMDNTFLSKGSQNPITLQRAYKGGWLTSGSPLYLGVAGYQLLFS